ncbi:MAG TPA: hypothetical protein DEB06_09335 [Phycisphaerales bacterium]|nr:hypothetical protein [Phycisphaerales bacterium]
MRHCIAAVGAAVALTVPSFGAVVPFTEAFDSSASNWRNAAGAANATWLPTGGPGNSAHITGATSVNNANTGVVIALRAQDAFNSSNDAFVGNWLALGVTAFSFDVRHDAPAPMSFGARFAPSANAPGAIGFQFAPVAPGQWSTVTIPIDPSFPGFVSFEFGNFAGIFSGIGNVQVSYLVPGALADSGTIVNVAVDNVRLLPAPGSAAILALAGTLALRRRRR